MLDRLVHLLSPGSLERSVVQSIVRLLASSLGRLVDALNDEAALSERGVQSVTGNLVATLANRLRVEDHLTQHPELLEQPVEAAPSQEGAARA